MKNPHSGKLFHDCLWAMCGKCEDHNPTGEDTREQAANVIREWGWQNISYVGWVCPKCIERLEQTATARNAAQAGVGI